MRVGAFNPFSSGGGTKQDIDFNFIGEIIPTMNYYSKYIVGQLEYSPGNEWDNQQLGSLGENTTNSSNISG